MFAIIQIGNTQYKVAEGDTLSTARVKGDKGKSITLEKVLMFSKGSDVRIGQPLLKDVKVTAKIVTHGLDKKVTAYKYRRRKDSATKNGHRQELSTINITKIAV